MRDSTRGPGVTAARLVLPRTTTPGQGDGARRRIRASWWPRRQFPRKASRTHWPSDAAGRFLYFGLLPAWGVPGLIDWWFHRRSAIEEPGHGSLKESILHSTMFSELAPSLGLVLFAEINPLVLSVLAGSAVLHQATALRDLTVASNSARKVSPGEQQIHTALEAMPFAVLLLAALHTRDPTADRWTFQRRLQPLPRAYTAGVLVLAALLGLPPYAEELLRCLRNQNPGTPTVGEDRGGEVANSFVNATQNPGR